MPAGRNTLLNTDNLGTVLPFSLSLRAFEDRPNPGFGCADIKHGRWP